MEVGAIFIKAELTKDAKTQILINALKINSGIIKIFGLNMNMETKMSKRKPLRLIPKWTKICLGRNR